MNLAKVLFLMLLCLGGGFYVWKYERGEVAPENESGEREEALFPGLQASTIQEVSITTPANSFRIEKSKSTTPVRREVIWTMQNPAGAETDYHNVRDLVSTLSELRSKHSIVMDDHEGGPELFGLDKPQLTLSFSAEGREHTIKFGKKHAFSGRRYLQVADEPTIRLVDESAFASLNKTPQEIRNRFPLRFSEADANLIRISRADGTSLQFERRGEEWISTGGGREFPVDPALMLRTLSGLSKLQVKSFIDVPASDLAAYGLAAPTVRVQISFETKDVEPLLIAIGEVRQPSASAPEGSIPSMFVRRGESGSVFEFDKRFYSDLLQPAEFFRDRQVFSSLNAQSVTKLEISSPQGRFSLIRSAPGMEEAPAAKKTTGEASPMTVAWSLESATNPGGEIDSAKVVQFIEAFRKLSVVSFPGVGSDSIGDVSTVVTVSADGGREKKEYRFGLGKAVSSSDAKDYAQAENSVSESEAPHYGFVSFGAEAVSVVVSGKDATSFAVSENNFKKPAPTN